MTMIDLWGFRISSFLLDLFLLGNPASKLGTPKWRSPDRATPLDIQNKSKFLQLPDEILLLISEHLGAGTRASLIQTCRYLHHLLERTLYRHVNLIYYQSDIKSSYLHRTLRERPDLIPLIRIYHGPLTPRVITHQPVQGWKLFEKFSKSKKAEWIDSGHTPSTRTDALEHAVSIYTQATNIVDLKFTDAHRWTADPHLEPIRAAVSTMPLHRLTLESCEEVGQVLRDQSELEELDLGWSRHNMQKLEKHHIPKLTSLRAKLPEAASLVPGRPVKQLHLSSGMMDEDFDEQLFGQLSLSTGPITELSTYLVASSEKRVRTSLRLIARNLPQVERLTIRVGGSILGQVILDEVPSFKCLQHLTFIHAILAPGGKGIQRVPIQTEWEDLFAQLKALCPVLVLTRFTPPMYFGCWE